MSRVYVKVEPDQDAFEVDTSGTYPRVSLTAAAQNGRANSQLLDRLEELLDARPRIVSGHRSSRKELAVDMEEDDVLDRLADA